MTTRLGAEFLREANDDVGECAPAEVRLDAEQQHDVVVEPGRAAVVEDRRRPVDAAGHAFLQSDVRTGGLEVEEVLRVDLGETLSTPELREVTGGERAPWPPSFQPRNAQRSKSAARGWAGSR